MTIRSPLLLAYALLFATGFIPAQEASQAVPRAELRLRIATTASSSRHAPPAVAWLDAIQGTPALPFVSNGNYTLVQKNRTFIPHLQVIPVGSVVQFPNADPFFHNVFSLFEGKRFDLGLYEAGSSRSVTFSREGASYIFCNIHPDMSAVVLALATPLYAIASADGAIELRGVPAGNYKIHFWIEGVPPSVLDSFARTIHITSAGLDLSTITVPITRPDDKNHLNEFGGTYDEHTHSTY
jgi:plastocyanin